MDNDYDKLDEALGINHDEGGEVTIYDPVAAGAESTSVVSAEDDSEFARRNIRDAIEKTKEALEAATEVAVAGGAASSVTALSALLTSVVNANEKLVTVSEKSRATKNGDDVSKVVNNTQNVVIVGTTDDLLKAVRKVRGEIDIEDELER